MRNLLIFMILAGCSGSPSPQDAADTDASTDADMPDSAEPVDASPDAPAGFWLSPSLTITPTAGSSMVTLAVVYHCADGANPDDAHMTTLGYSLGNGSSQSYDTIYTCGGGFHSTTWFDIPCGSIVVGHVSATRPDGVVETADTSPKTACN